MIPIWKSCLHKGIAGIHFGVDKEQVLVWRHHNAIVLNILFIQIQVSGILKNAGILQWINV